MLWANRLNRRVVAGTAGAAILAAAALWQLGWGGYQPAHYNENLLRLHVVANSDSPADQELKLQVRDALVPLLQELLQGSGSAEEAATAVETAQADLARRAATVVSAHGYAYPVRVELSVTDFPAGQEKGVRLPPGRYKALKVVIGQGAGHNWWCVLFPPLCFNSERVAVAPPVVAAKRGKVATIQWRWRFFDRTAGVAYAEAKKPNK